VEGKTSSSALPCAAGERHDTSVRDMAVSDDGSKLYVCALPSCVLELTTVDSKRNRLIPTLGVYPVSMALSLSEIYIAYDHYIRTVDLGRASPVINVCPDTKISCIVGARNPKSVYSIVICLWDGRIFAISSGSTTALPKFQPLKCVPILCAAFAPNERHLILGKRDGTVTMIDTKTWTEVATFVCNSPVTSVAVSPKSQLIIAGDALGKVYLLKYYRR